MKGSSYKPRDKSKAQMLSACEVAELLGISCCHIYSMIEDGIIPHIRLGKMIRIPRAKIMAIINCETEPKQTD